MSSLSEPKQQFKLNERVQYFSSNQNEWYKATVQSYDSSEHVYKVKLDGSGHVKKAQGVPEKLRPLYEKGDHVMYYSATRLKWFPAIVTSSSYTKTGELEVKVDGVLKLAMNDQLRRQKNSEVSLTFRSVGGPGGGKLPDVGPYSDNRHKYYQPGAKDMEMKRQLGTQGQGTSLDTSGAGYYDQTVQGNMEVLGDRLQRLGGRLGSGKGLGYKNAEKATEPSVRSVRFAETTMYDSMPEDEEEPGSNYNQMPADEEGAEGEESGYNYSKIPPSSNASLRPILRKNTSELSQSSQNSSKEYGNSNSRASSWQKMEQERLKRQEAERQHKELKLYGELRRQEELINMQANELVKAKDAIEKMLKEITELLALQTTDLKKSQKPQKPKNPNIPLLESKHLHDARVFCVRLKPGADLLKSLEKYASMKGIEAGYVQACVGSTATTVLRPAGVKTPRVFNGKYEIVSMSGTISKDGCHIHLSIADPACAVYGGHLLEGTLVRTCAEIVIGNVEGMTFLRKLDKDTGYDELYMTE
eukprot:CAMPEP_0184485702 /NCGR_PEP_ID=MMETSP0113_2-20130426/7283_1 /TAXON_ID=91329 /ORGANISM="Norrisiella sphaerica, Strain BC52" /LENGTH=528 /DNA_ID=CAMNT_0026867271 /DNA_START=152 /DNA_END=1738 /DNA_ORIENTATION=-